MILFAVVMGLLLLLALGLMFHHVFGSQTKIRVDHERMNVELAREQLSQLKELHRQKQIGEAELASSKAEVENNLAMNLQGSSRSEHEGTKTSWREKSILLLLAPGVVALAVLMYLDLGEPRALDSDFVISMSPEENSTINGRPDQQAAELQEQLPSIDELLPRLEEHLETHPDDAKGWSLLGTTYLRMQQYADADQALSRALELLPDNADLMLQLADAKAMLGSGVLKGAPEALVDSALLTAPNDARALWLKGMASEQSGDLEDAIARWQQLLPQLQNDPPSLLRMQNMIADTKARLSGEAGAESQPATGSSEETDMVDQSSAGKAAGHDTAVADVEDLPALQIEVELDEKLLNRVGDADLVYVYAKASEGPPMPLAVVRKTVADLPLQVVLDDSMAMMPQLKLSSFSRVTIGARVSLTGNPVAQKGDFFSEVQNVTSPSAEVVRVVIDSIVN